MRSKLVTLDSAQRRFVGECASFSPAIARCAIQIGAWCETITTSPESVDSHASSMASTMRAAVAVNGSPQLGFDGLTSRRQLIGFRTARFMRLPANEFHGSMTRSSCSGVRSNSSANGSADSRARCNGEEMRRETVRPSDFTCAAAARAISRPASLRPYPGIRS